MAETCPTCGEPAPPGVGLCPRDGTVLPFARAATVSLSASASGQQPQAPQVALPVTQTAEIDPLIGGKCGEYDIIEPLGAGGMGMVYRAVQPVIGKSVALKVLRWEIARDPQQMQRLLSEARTVNAIRHRGIIDIFNFGQLPDGRQYLVMELLDGVPLDRVMAGQPLGFADALSFLDELADALAAAHSVGVIHRDLKPSNVFVVTPPRGLQYLKLLDFGLAKQATAPGGTTPQTRASMLVGTPHYMAPEQARGQEISPHTDLYALGVMAFEMLTGRLPFEAQTPFEIVYKHLNEKAPRVSTLRADVPAVLDELVAKLLEKERALRPHSADEVRLALDPLRAEFPLRTARVSVPGMKAVPDTRQAPQPVAPPSKVRDTVISGGGQPNAPLVPAQAAVPLRDVAPSLELQRPTRDLKPIAIGGGLLAVAIAAMVLFPRPAPTPAAIPVAVATTPEVKPPVEPPRAVEVKAVEAVAVKALPGHLSLTSTLPCEAFEGDRSLGKTPLKEIELPGGKHVLRCRTAAGSETSVEVKLEPAATLTESFAFPTGRLEIWVVPYADVAVDGKSYGETPIKPVELAEGRHRIDLKMDAKRVTRSISLKAGEVAKLKVDMEAAGP